MLILAVESSAKAASAALWRDGEMLSLVYQNSGLTHSRTLLPMVEDMLKNTGVRLDEADLLACAAGPGSFTGLRIGLSTVKGLGWALDKPCIGVSTLEAMAMLVCHIDGLICPVMDARRDQVYNALFRSEGGSLTRLSPDRAIGMPELKQELEGFPDPQILIGDGALLCYNEFGKTMQIAPPHLRMQNAWGVARAASGADPAHYVTPDKMAANYIRLSQAERERR